MPLKNFKIIHLTQAAVILLSLAMGVGQAAVDDHNVVIVLDASGSMGGKMPGSSVMKMDAAKSALKQVIREVPWDTNIGLLVFSAGNLDVDWVYPLGPRNDDKLLAAIDRPEPFGGTPLGEYLKMGADRLLKQRAEQYGYGTYRLLVVTDGEAGDPDMVERFVPEIIARGIIIDVIGVDMAGQHTLATKVHSYRSADNPGALKTAIADVFAEVAAAGTDGFGEDAFAVIEPIPQEMAVSMLKALSSSGNQPIGEGPGATGDDGRYGDSASSSSSSCLTVLTSFFAVLIIGLVVFIMIIILIVRARRS
ncbi:MAG: VWA domain-containing protein [Acidobacteria bacterium]|nr:VWA domain-containing protein [Acidobacteriota bacterium]